MGYNFLTRTIHKIVSHKRQGWRLDMIKLSVAELQITGLSKLRDILITVILVDKFVASPVVWRTETRSWNRTARQRIRTRIFFLGILFLNNKELGCNISVKFIWFYCLQSESVSALSLLVPSRPRRMFMKWREKCKIIKTNNDYTTQASYWIRGIEAVQGTLVTLPVLSEDLFPPCWPSERCHDVDVLTHLVLLMRWLVWLAWLANSVASWK